MATRDKKVGITCEEFQALIPGWVEHRVDLEDIKLHPHAQTCQLCMELLRELRLAAEEAKQRFGGGYLN